MKTNRLIVLLLLVAVISIMKAHAGCEYINGYAPKTSVINFGNIIVQRDIPTGSVIAKITDTGLAEQGFNIQCDATLRNMKYGDSTYSTFVYDGTTYFDIGVEGFGVRVTSNSGAWQSVWNGGALPILLINDGRCQWSGDSWIKYCGGSWGSGGINFELVKVAEKTTSGDVPAAGNIIAASIDNEMDAYYWKLSPGKISVMKCNATTSSLSFNLGDVSATSFSGAVGSSPENAQVTTNIELDCDADANINVMLSGVQNPDTTSQSVLALTGQGDAGVAQGVGVQLLYNGTPLELNKNIVLKKSTGGQETFPIVARYYQTKTTVMPGTANTSATLNLTYQ